MSDHFLSAASKTNWIISRVNELELIQNAIYHEEHDCVMILVKGNGGLGKSRLLEEVMWRAGQVTSRKNRPMPADADGEIDWTHSGAVLVTAVIDMRDINLHSRSNFLREIARTLVENNIEVDFSVFNNQVIALERLQSQQGDYKMVKKALDEVERAFLSDYQNAAQDHRVVLLIDTVEQFAYTQSKLLLEQKFITAKDLALSTQQWLLDRAADGSLPNTTILLAGRVEEGSIFFDQVAEVNKNASQPFQLIHLPITAFDESDTKEYIRALDRDWQERLRLEPKNQDVRRIADSIHAIAADDERMQVLYLFTDGQPVRLSLYTDLIIDGLTIPPALNDSYKNTLKRVEEEGLDQVRDEIEGEFVQLLFANQNLKSQILQVLVRVQRVLTVGQLHWVLGSRLNQDITQWQVYSESLEHISQALRELQSLSIVKSAPGGGISLQDEIYRIYSRHKQFEERILADERSERKRLYTKLKDWTTYQRGLRENQRQEFQTSDEHMIKIDDPANALSAHFPDLELDEHQRRMAIYQQTVMLSVEEMYYAILLNPERAINEEYHMLCEAFALANFEEGMVMAQAELWRILNDPYLLDFVDLDRNKNLHRPEPARSILFRDVQQSDVALWARRFILREEYLRTLELLDKLDEYIRTLEPERIRNSWNHTFARGERMAWRIFAQGLMLFVDEEKLGQAIETAGQLEQLAEKSYLEVSREYVLNGQPRKEYGFIGHPAETRLKNVIAILYNYIGLGYVALAYYRKAIYYYGRSLHYTRETRFIAMQASALRNLARAMSEIGRERARRVCMDGLNLSKKLAYENPIAFAYTTLALVDNDQVRPDLAVVEAATALAYFRRTEHERGIGLALIQLGETLRRLVMRMKQGGSYAGVPNAILTESEHALNEALRIFDKKDEPVRQVEALIELGCLYRDWLEVVDKEKHPSQWNKHYRSAYERLEKAARLAHGLGSGREEIDALVNLAWALFRGEDSARAIEALDRLEADRRLVPADCILRAGEPQPDPKHEKSYIYYQLAKMYTLRGMVAMQAFTRRVEEIRAPDPIMPREIRQDRISAAPMAREALKNGAEYFVLALAYAQLFSVRSNSLASIYDRLYEYLKSFNGREFQDFLSFQRDACKRYKTDTLQTENLAELEEFMLECFGIPSVEE